MARTAGEGTVWKNEKRGRWEGQLTLSYDPTTKKRKRQKVTGRTRSEVVAKMDAARTALGQGRSPAVEKRTVGQYLDAWLVDVLPGTVASTTLVQYSDVVRLYIKPHIGTKKLGTLSPQDVARMARTLLSEGRAPNTVRLARSVLRRALRCAEQEGTISRNVAAIADGVKVPAPEGRSLTVEQSRQLLGAVAGHRLEAAIVVALSLGLRRGELLGLTWADADLDGDKPTVTITRSLKRIPRRGLEISAAKTRGSRRRIHLPAPAVDALKAHRARQAAERLALGSAWPALAAGHDLIFRSPLGTPVDPDNFTKETYRVTLDAFTPVEMRPKTKEDKWPVEYRWSPHALRHSTASLLIAQEVPLKVISEVLGHSSIRITADVYGHLLDDAGLVAAEAMTSALWG